LGGLYIGVFRSSWSISDEDGQHRRHEAHLSMGDTAWPGARTTYARLGLVALLVDFLISICLSWLNINAVKILGQFEFWKVS
jgi:hypothetical protein